MLFKKWLEMDKKVKERQKKPAISPQNPEYKKNEWFLAEYKYIQACYRLIDVELDRREGKQYSAEALEHLKTQVRGWLNDINTYNKIETTREPIPWTPNTKHPYLRELETLSHEQLTQEQEALGDQLNDIERSGAKPPEAIDEKKAKKYRHLKAKYDVVDWLLDRHARPAKGKFQSNPKLEAEDVKELESKLSIIDESKQLHSHLRFLMSLTSEALDYRLLNLSRKIHECRQALPMGSNQDRRDQWLKRWELVKYEAEQRLGLMEKVRRNQYPSMDPETYWSQYQQELKAALAHFQAYWKQKKEPEQLSEDSLQFLAKGASSFFTVPTQGQRGKEEILFIKEIEDERKWPDRHLLRLSEDKWRQLAEIKKSIGQAVGQSSASYQGFLSSPDIALPEFDEVGTERLSAYQGHLAKQSWAEHGVEVVPHKKNLNTDSKDKPQAPAKEGDPLTKPVMGRSILQDEQFQKKLAEIQRLRAEFNVIKGELYRRQVRNGEAGLSERNIAKTLNIMSDYWESLLI